MVRAMSETERVRVSRYLRALSQVFAPTGHTTEADDVAREAVSTLVESFDAVVARVWIHDAGTETTLLRAALPPSPALVGTPTQKSGTPPHEVATVLRTRHSYIKESLSEDIQFDAEWLQRTGITSLAALPLVAGDSLLGVLVYFSDLDLPPDVLEVLKTFAALLSATLNDAAMREEAQNARARAEAVQSRLDVIEEISVSVHAHLSLDDTLDDLLRRLKAATDSDEATILLLNDEGNALQVRGSIGLEREVTESVQIPFGRGVAGRVAASQKPVIIPDLRQVDAVSPWLREQYRSLVAVPLIVEGRSVGVLHVGTETPRTYTEDDARLLMTVGERAATALERARLYELQREALYTAREAMRAREEFAAGMSHDLRNPLTTIIAQTQMLQRRLARMDGSDLDRIERGLHNIADAADKLDRSINVLVEVARQPGDHRPVAHRVPTDLVGLTRKVVEQHRATAENHDIDLRSRVPQLLGLWDPSQIERVLGNLLNNACKYSPAGGPILVHVGQEESGGRSWAWLQVVDRGIGIPNDDLPRVFDRFHRGSNVVGRIEGSGIGLAGVKQIVELHGGNVAVQSREGEGATFTVRIPLLQTET